MQLVSAARFSALWSSSSASCFVTKRPRTTDAVHLSRKFHVIGILVDIQAAIGRRQRVQRKCQRCRAPLDDLDDIRYIQLKVTRQKPKWIVQTQPDQRDEQVKRWRDRPRGVARLADHPLAKICCMNDIGMHFVLKNSQLGRQEASHATAHELVLTTRS